MISSENTPCSKSSVNYNVTLSKGTKAGKYYKMAGISKMDDCVGHCCRSKRCDVAFMVNKNCYLVKCHNSNSCELKQSDNPKFDTMLSVVSKSKAVEGKKVHYQYELSCFCITLPNPPTPLFPLTVLPSLLRCHKLSRSAAT